MRLLEAARRGGTSAYSALVRHYYASLFRMAYALTRSRGEAVSMVKETVARGLEEVRQVPEDRPFFPWWLWIMRNLLLARLRALGGRSPAPPDDPAAATKAGGLDPSVVERYERALADVEPDDQLVLALRLVERLPYEQIERVLMLGPGTVPTRISNALARIQVGLGERV